MSNQRSVMTEFRFLDQKRQAEGLTAEEAARYAQLRDLVGPETAGPPRTGFDVNAAAAKLRESLLPAGLRTRPPEAAPPPPPPVEAPPEPAAEALALEQAWAEAPFTELAAEPADPLFDPGSLAQEVRPQAWNPEAPGYDPNAPYDEAAWIAAGYDPNATYDWSAYGYGPDGQPLAADAGAAPLEGAPVESAAEPFAEAAPLDLAEAAPVDGAPFEAAAMDLAEPPPLEGAPVEVAAQDFAEAAPVEGAPWDAAAPPVEIVEADVDEGLLTAEATPAPAAVDGGPLEVAPEAWAAEAEAAPTEAAAPEGVEQAWDGAVELGEPEPPPPAGLEQDWGAAAIAGVLDLGEVGAAPAPEAPPPARAPDEEALPFDPNAPFDHAKWFGRPAVEAAAAAPTLEAVPEPAVEPELAVDLGAEPPAPAFGEYDESAAPAPLEAEALDLGDLDVAAAPAAEPEAAIEVATAPFAEPEPALPSSLDPLPLEGAPADGEPPAAWLGEAEPTSHLPAPAGAPFGDYDEAAAPLAGAPSAADGLEAMLPFDPAAASAIEPGAMPEGYDSGGPVLDPAALPPAEGAYDDTAGFTGDQMYGGPEGEELPGGTPLELGADMPDWQPEAALEQGFELASDGSFGHAELPPGARTPAWGTAVAAPADGWESAPALDLAGPFDAPAPAAQAPIEDLPTIDGAELLEELPPEPPASEAGRSPLDGAFDDVAAVEAAAYPPPDLAEPFAEPFSVGEPPSFEPEPAPTAAPEPEPAEPAAAADPFAAPEAPAAAPDPFAAPVPADLLEPEPAISYEAAPEGLPPEIAAAYASAPASSDTFELPPAVAEGLFDPAPEPEPEPVEVEPLPPPAPTVAVAGSHRVVLHTVDGQVKRGLLVDALLDAPALPLQPQGPGTAEQIPTEGIKAIFFMLAPGEKAPAPEGKKVRVTFRDGRQVAGFSPDYQEGLAGFFMIPADTRTNTGRIWVYQAAVKTVAVS